MMGAGSSFHHLFPKAAGSFSSFLFFVFPLSIPLPPHGASLKTRLSHFLLVVLSKQSQFSSSTTTFSPLGPKITTHQKKALTLQDMAQFQTSAPVWLEDAQLCVLGCSTSLWVPECSPQWVWHGSQLHTAEM